MHFSLNGNVASCPDTMGLTETNAEIVFEGRLPKYRLRFDKRLELNIDIHV